MDEVVFHFKFEHLILDNTDDLSYDSNKETSIRILLRVFYKKKQYIYTHGRL